MAETPAAGVEQPTPKILTLVSSDGQSFDVLESVAVQSITIKNLVEDGCGDGPIPLGNVTGEVLITVLEFLKNHAGDSDGEEKKKNDKELLGNDMKDLFEYILAANYLNIKGLNDVVAQMIADSIKDKSPEFVRNLFGIENDYSKEEEAAVRKEYEWAYDDIKDN